MRAERILVSLAAVVACGVLLAGQSAPQFKEHLLADKYGYAFGVQAADLDGDGDLDLTSCDTTNGFLYWFENDGMGKFTRHVIVDKELGWLERHRIADLNGDGKPDVVIVLNNSGGLLWFENPGNPAKAERWPRHAITKDWPRAYDVDVADVDGDGLPDVAASNYLGGAFAWFKNPGKIDEAWAKHMIDKDLQETRTVRFADFNGDGKPDLFATARPVNLTAWYENPGKTGGAWKKHVIDGAAQQPTHGHPVDMDGDGDLDVVLALGMTAGGKEPTTNKVVWYENVGKPGKATEWKEHLIGRLPTAFEAIAGDLDADGQLDVAATGFIQGKIVWFRNPGKTGGAWSMHVLKDPWARANAVILADVNGDRLLDVIATSERGSNELRWWQNLGAKK